MNSCGIVRWSAADQRRFDNLFLSNYATINLMDTIKRIPGVGDASMFGAEDYSMRIVLDIDRLMQEIVSLDTRQQMDELFHSFVRVDFKA